MTELDAILKAVCENPGDDLPRLMYADAVEDMDPERSWFIRNQLATDYRRDWEMKTKPKTKMTREQLVHSTAVPGLHPVGWDNEAICYSPEMYWPTVHRIDVIFSRGFPDSITCDWPTFLRVADALIWHYGATVECPHCGDGKSLTKGYCPECGAAVTADQGDITPCCEVEAVPCDCEECGATGRVPKPFPPTAQPITMVTLTSPYAGRGGDNWEVDWFRMPDENGEGYRFTRVKCPTCDDASLRRGEDASRSRMPIRTCWNCQGRPINEWHCEKWPTVRFVMPAAVRVEGIEGWARRAGQTVRVTGTGTIA